MAPRNPSKEKNKWKGNHKIIVYECNQLFKKFYGFLKDVETHGALSNMASQITTLKASIYEKEKTL